MGKTFIKSLIGKNLQLMTNFDKKMFPGVVCPSPWTIYIYMTIISNISSESTVSNAMKAKFYLEPLLEEEKNVCLNFQGHMAAMPIYGENF